MYSGYCRVFYKSNTFFSFVWLHQQCLLSPILLFCLATQALFEHKLFALHAASFGLCIYYINKSKNNALEISFRKCTSFQLCWSRKKSPTTFMQLKCWCRKWKILLKQGRINFDTFVYSAGHHILGELSRHNNG